MGKHVDWVKKPSVVALSGKESFFKHRELDRASEQLPDFHEEYYQGGKDDQDLRDSLMTGSSPFMSLKKLIVVSDANKIKKRAFLESYCDNPESDRVLVLVSSNKGRVAKWFKTLKVSVRKKYEKIPDYKLGPWLVTEAQARGYSLRKDHAEAIVMNVGSDLYMLSNELEKITIYCGNRKNIKAEDIQAVLYGHTAMSPFEVIRYWGIGQKDVALRVFLQHFEKTPETQWIRSELVLIKGFLDRVENLITAKSLRNAGAGDSEIISALGLSPWIFKNKVADQINTRSISELTEAYNQLCEIETKAKMGKPGHLLLQTFIVRY